MFIEFDSKTSVMVLYLDVLISYWIQLILLQLNDDSDSPSVHLGIHGTIDSW